MDPYVQYLIAAAVLTVPILLAWLVYELHLLRKLAIKPKCCSKIPQDLLCGYIVYIWDGEDWRKQVDECKSGCVAPPAPQTDGHYVGECRVMECVAVGAHMHDDVNPQ